MTIQPNIQPYCIFASIFSFKCNCFLHKPTTVDQPSHRDRKNTQQTIHTANQTYSRPYIQPTIHTAYHAHSQSQNYLNTPNVPGSNVFNNLQTYTYIQTDIQPYFGLTWFCQFCSIVWVSMFPCMLGGFTCNVTCWIWNQNISSQCQYRVCYASAFIMSQRPNGEVKGQLK